MLAHPPLKTDIKKEEIRTTKLTQLMNEMLKQKGLDSMPESTKDEMIEKKYKENLASYLNELIWEVKGLEDKIKFELLLIKH
jgi:hypothetical protein